MKYDIKKKQIITEPKLDKNEVYAEDELERLFGSNPTFSINSRLKRGLETIEKVLYVETIDESDVEAFERGEEVTITKEFHPNIADNCSKDEMDFIQNVVDKSIEYSTLLDSISELDLFNITGRIG